MEKKGKDQIYQLLNSNQINPADKEILKKHLSSYEMLLKNYDEIVNKFNIYRKAIRNLTKEKDKESPNKELEELDSHFKKEVAELRNIMVDNQKNITHMNDVIAENKKEIETLTKNHKKLKKEFDDSKTSNGKKLADMEKMNANLMAEKREVQQREFHFSEKNEEINKQLQVMKEREKHLQEMVQQKNKEIEDLSQKADSLELVISQKQNKIWNLNNFFQSYKKQHQLEQQQSKIETQEYIRELNNIRKTLEDCNQIFVRSNSLICKLGLNQTYSSLLRQNISKFMGLKVEGLQSLYNFNLQRNEDFHKIVDFKKNILLICLTESNDIVGGFTSFGFSLKSQDEKVKAFLFNMRHGQMNVFPLKKDRDSTKYDSEYLLFGYQDLSIERGSKELHSSFIGDSSGMNHYEGKQQDRETFLGEDKKSMVKLLNYQIAQVIFEK